MIRHLASRLLPVICLVGLTACGMFGPARTPKVPAPAVTSSTEPVRLPPEPETKEPEQLPAPPKIADTKVDVPAVEPPVTPMETPPPPEPVQPSSTTRTRSLPLPPQRQMPEAEPFPEPPSGPRLTQLLSDEEKWDYGQEIDARLIRVHELISELEKRPLEENQMALLDRVRGFVRQTNDTRQKDPITARSLSQRAELLAKELESATR